jgi:cation:H+ antiporter
VTIVLLSLAAGFVLLALGGEALVRGSAALGLRAGLNPVLVGLTIVGFGTSAPELAVSVQAALGGAGDIAVGNIVGSNVANVGLVLGLAALLKPLTLSSRLVRRDVPIMIGASAVMVVFLLDGRLSRPEGAVLAAGIVLYLAYTARESHEERRRVMKEFRTELKGDSPSLSLSSAAVLAGVAALVGGGRLFVGGATGLAAALGVPEAVIGLTIVAVGTSLPEMATSLVAGLRGHPDIATGNVVGSNIFNVLAVLGVTALVHPIERGGVGDLDLGLMMAFVALPLPLALWRNRVGRLEGGLLLVCYALYIARLIVQT